MKCSVQIRVNGKICQTNKNKSLPLNEQQVKDSNPNLAPASNNLFFSLNHSTKLAKQSPQQITDALAIFETNPNDNLADCDNEKLQKQLLALISLLEFDCGADNLPPLAHHIENIILAEENENFTADNKIAKLKQIIQALDNCAQLCQQQVIGEHDIIVKRSLAADKHNRQQEYGAVIEQLTAHCQAALEILQSNGAELVAGRSQLQLRDYSLLCQGESKVDDGRANKASAVREGLRSGADDLNACAVNLLHQNGPQNGAIAGGLAAGIQLGAIYFSRKQGKFADFKNKLAKNLLMLNHLQLVKLGKDEEYPGLSTEVGLALGFCRDNNFKNSRLFKGMITTSSVSKLRRLTNYYKAQAKQQIAEEKKQPLDQSFKIESAPISKQRSKSVSQSVPELARKNSSDHEKPKPTINPNFSINSDEGMRALARLNPVLQEIKNDINKSTLNFDEFKRRICRQIQLYVKLEAPAAEGMQKAEQNALLLEDSIHEFANKEVSKSSNLEAEEIKVAGDGDIKKSSTEDHELEKVFFTLLHFCLSKAKSKSRTSVKSSIRQQYSTLLTRLFSSANGQQHLAAYFKHNASESFTKLSTASSLAMFERQALRLLSTSAKSSYTNNLMLVMVALNENEHLTVEDKTAIRDYICKIEANPNYGHLFAITNNHQANYLKNGISTLVRYGLHNTPTMSQCLGLAGQPLAPSENFALQSARWSEWQLNVTANSSSHPLLPRTHSANTALAVLETARGLSFAKTKKADLSKAEGAIKGDDELKADEFYEKYAKFTRQNGKWQPNSYHTLQSTIKADRNLDQKQEVRDELAQFLEAHPMADFKAKGITYQPEQSTEEFMLWAAQLPWGNDDAMTSLLHLQAIIMRPQTQNKLEKQKILELILSGGLADANSVVHHLTKHSANKNLAYGVASSTLGAAVYALSIALIPVKGIGLVATKLAGNYVRMNLSNGEIIQRAVNTIPSARPNRYRAPQTIFAYCRRVLEDEAKLKGASSNEPLLANEEDNLKQPLLNDNVDKKNELDAASQKKEPSAQLYNRLDQLALECDDQELTNEQRLEKLWQTVTIFGNQQLDRRLAQQLAEKIIDHPQLKSESSLWKSFGEEADHYRSLFFASFILALKNKSLFAVCRCNKFSSKLNLALASVTTLGPAMMGDLGISDTLGLKGLAIDVGGGVITGLNNLQAQGKFNRTESYAKIIGKCKRELTSSFQKVEWERDSAAYKIVRQAFSVKRFKFSKRLRHPFKSLCNMLTPNTPTHRLAGIQI